MQDASVYKSHFRIIYNSEILFHNTKYIKLFTNIIKIDCRLKNNKGNCDFFSQNIQSKRYKAVIRRRRVWDCEIKCCKCLFYFAAEIKLQKK